MRPAPLTLLISLTIFLAACGRPFWLPEAHKIEIQQGNLLNAQQLEKLQVGMTRDEVLRVVGKPVLDSAFHSNRWDYVYTKGPAGNVIKARYVTLLFDDDNVIKVTDNHALQTGEIPEQKSWWRRLFRLG